MNQKHKKLLLALIASSLLVIVLTSLSHLLSEISFAEVKQALGEISAAQLLLAAAGRERRTCPAGQARRALSACSG